VTLLSNFSPDNLIKAAHIRKLPRTRKTAETGADFFPSGVGMKLSHNKGVRSHAPQKAGDLNKDNAPKLPPGGRTRNNFAANSASQPAINFPCACAARPRSSPAHRCTSKNTQSAARFLFQRWRRVSRLLCRTRAALIFPRNMRKHIKRNIVTTCGGFVIGAKVSFVVSM
jgi:hypothetical protein